MKKNNKESEYLTQQQITARYEVPKTIIRKYFPRGTGRTVRSRRGGRWTIPVWTVEEVEQALQRPEVAKALEERRQELLEQQQCREAADSRSARVHQQG